MINMEIVHMGPRSFYLYRTFKERDKPIDTDLLKELWHCDSVLKKDGVFYFCREIEDVEFENIP
jgi:hypothetical protein